MLIINDRHFLSEVIAKDLGIGSKVTPPLPYRDKLVYFLHAKGKVGYNSYASCCMAFLTIKDDTTLSCEQKKNKEAEIWCGTNKMIMLGGGARTLRSLLSSFPVLLVSMS